jgi:antitoxin component of MazEF toxin-antitoxin module
VCEAEGKKVIFLKEGIVPIPPTLPGMLNANQANLVISPLQNNGAIIQNPTVLSYEFLHDSRAVNPEIVITTQEKDPIMRPQP